ncbi:Na(+)/H(+) antiporter NhaA-like [Lepeophtheirus salmonis]|uniref:Na(+)/H(+) antiporter NhaA-like n=1 Tax=Lepeophtheirus salmonis TaxID=72036 RepID=UPI001AE904B3|nr:Na(+)/H(+) antiporter NhaA-like [Lepeophtheirus salmonis]
MLSWVNLPIVNVINFQGVIMSDSKFSNNRINIDSFEKIIEAAFKPRNLVAVCLRINSPGGSPVQSDLVASMIKEKSEERPEVKVVSFAEDMALSGGYWLLCAGEEIYVNKSSFIGSIGAIVESFGFHEIMKTYGIERRIITAGKNKSMMDPFREMSKDECSKIHKNLAAIHEIFKEHVKEARGDRLTSNEEEIFNGDFWSGQDAINLGLADGIHSVRSWIRSNFGQTVYVKYLKGKSKNPLSSLFGTRNTLSDEIDELTHTFKFK